MIYVLLAIVVLGFVGVFYKINQFNSITALPPVKEEDSNEFVAEILTVLKELKTSANKVDKTLDGLPTKTLNTIQGSVNNTTGKLGEMMQLIELKSAYDRLEVVGGIIDYLGVRFPADGREPAIDFIDVKTGKSAALNADQKKLRDLITSNPACISFKTVKVSIT